METQKPLPENQEVKLLNCDLTTSAGPDESLCSTGGSVQLNGSATGSYCAHYWTPAAGLSDPWSLNPQAWVTQTTTYTLTSVGENPGSPNLLFNPDFEQGDVGFRSNYFWDDSGVLNEEAYVITTRGDLAKWDWDRCTDHTPNGVNMMCVNASTLGNVEVWCQTVDVEPNTDYIFSLWLVTLHPASPARLEFRINGEVIGPPFTASPTTCQWEQNCSAWFSGGSTTADVCIINRNTDSWGNDFAIDDLSFSKACVVRDDVTIHVLSQPDVQNLQLTCLPDNLSYQLSFDLAGGASAGYLINGIGGSWNGDTFTSDPLPINTPYAFQIADPLGCGLANFQGTHSCPCLSEAGTLQNASLDLCEDEAVSFSHNGDFYLDGNDLLRYVLHDQPTPTLGNILAVSDQPLFNHFPALAFETTYYVSAVVANNDGFDNIEWSDQCLSLSPSMPLRFYARPSAGISAPSAVCLGDPATLSFQLEPGSYNLSYTDGQQQFVLDNIQDGHTLSILLTETTEFQLTSISRTNAPRCTNSLDVAIQVTVLTAQPVEVQAAICAGESIRLGGDWQSMPGTFLDTLASSLGCDSIVQTDLIVRPPDSTWTTATSCDPSDAGVSLQRLTNRFGCDSLVWTDVTYQMGDTIQLFSESCYPVDTGWRMEHFSNRYGCDSLIQTYTRLLRTDTTYLAQTSCSPLDTG
ncbi:MAG: hypothetical protein AAF990_25540, partial [Bacteroidota bacterium]